MKVTNFPKKISSGKRTMILGSFNTFHNGHKELLDQAKKYKNKVMAMIIDDLSLLKNTNKSEFESLNIRLQHMANIGIDEVVVVKFNTKIKAMTGNEFATELSKIYNVEKFVVGRDFKMGSGGEYKAHDLANDFDTEIVEIKKINGKKISTSLLKEFVEFGDVSLVKKNSPFYFTLDARINVDGTFKIDGLKPHSGIYAAWAIINDVKYWASVRISKENKHEIKVPELILKNSGYNVQIEFVHKIRAIIKKDLDVLTESDLKITLEYLKKHL